MRTQAFCLANTALATAVVLFTTGLWPSLAVLYLTAVVLTAHKVTSR